MAGATIAKELIATVAKTGRDRHAFIERETSVPLTSSSAPSGE
jgi:hypothetical protein